MKSLPKKHVIACLLLLLLMSACAPEWGGGERARDTDDSRVRWSVARHWNEALLEAIRHDLARPTVHARNLFHSAALMYDAWAVYQQGARPYLLSEERFGCQMPDEDRQSLRTGQDVGRGEVLAARAMSFGMRRFLHHRFRDSPGREFIDQHTDEVFVNLGFSSGVESRDFRAGSDEERAAALGLFLADCIVAYGLQDGANEAANYANQYYHPVNRPLKPHEPGTSGLSEPDHWQPLELLNAIDQSGNQVGNTPKFIGAEWGDVAGFSLAEADLSLYEREGHTWRVYMDPGPPAYLRGPEAERGAYQWHHSLVARWSAHLDPLDGVIWDISPGSIGQTNELPSTLEEFERFYDSFHGGVSDHGHPINPHTAKPYAPNLVPRGDYTRVLAEFWADGPDSETPPGHWFTIANQLVTDHPDLQKRFRGQGPLLSDLEWDVKIYFVLGGGLHDAAVAAWSIKGWYDYVRPISAIRYMASQGQSSGAGYGRYNPEGMPLQEGLAEMVAARDDLAGVHGENIGKVKIWAWQGSDHISDPKTEVAGVGWILAENWVPYQRPSFVTPPFAGYLSGHSTFSRAAAEMLTYFTGDEFFPGGMGQFVAKRNEFLVFEDGPSEDITLQWATYRDASDQTSLSRIWGGIHPPIDDIPGRRLGIAIGAKAFAYASGFFVSK